MDIAKAFFYITELHRMINRARARTYEQQVLAPLAPRLIIRWLAVVFTCTVVAPACTECASLVNSEK